MSKTIHIALADDELLFRQGLKALLSGSQHIKIVFDAEDGQDLITKLDNAKELPEIVITDLKMPGLNGVEATKIIRQKYPDIKIIALTSYFSKPFILNMISIGAVAYLAKNSTPDLMIKTINEVSEKGFYYDAQVLKYVHESILNPNVTKKSELDSDFITTRELEVLKLICKQHTTNEIADTLCISHRTVEGYRKNLLEKTGSKNLAGLVVFAITHKLVAVGESFE